MSEVQTISLKDKTYSVDSITDHGNTIIQDLQKVEGLIQQQQLELSVSNLAKGKLLEELEKESSKFNEV